MEDPLRELVEEIPIIHPLIAQMTGIVVEAKCRVIAHCLQCPTGREGIESDLRRVHLQRKPYTQPLVRIQDRHEPTSELRIARLNHRLRHGREGI